MRKKLLLLVHVFLASAMTSAIAQSFSSDKVISSFDLADKKRVFGTHVDMGAFEFDEDATGIGKGEEVKRLKGESYNLAGQRVPDSQSYKGIIIENNKKTLNTLKR